MKEIKVTESYLTLDEKIRKCQDKEHQDDCRTKHYIASVLQNCGCLPLRIADSKNVDMLIMLISIQVLIYTFLGSYLCSRGT